MKGTSFKVRGAVAPQRLDKTLREAFPDWGRQAVQRAITGGQVRVNGKEVWLCSWQVRTGDQIELATAPVAKPAGPAAFDERWLITVDDDLIAINKPAGLLSEPARNEAAANVLQLVQSRFGPATLVHRLDRDTSGVLLLARTVAATRLLSEAFRHHTAVKEYLAVTRPAPGFPPEGIISFPLAPDAERRDKMMVVRSGGQRAVTRYAVIAGAAGRMLLRLWPETGRQHQLRVHLAASGIPILGDRLYGDPTSAPRLLLHAERLCLPWEERERVFEAEAPEELRVGGTGL
jgi:23S rRNA pseudouridine1911/1915/1917 synthase